SAATPAAATAAADSATLVSSGWTPAEEATPVSTVATGMPAVASAGRSGFGFGTPRYGFKPTVMHRPVVAG
ncbi:MAG TPA: PE/PPE C-terminal domain-containing protein, partial [Mycobacterium sp.]|nr:PE/PPE C-terminal domain-containing protein [Mycobacterium sp.]